MSRFLVVDDDPSVSEVVVTCLRTAGHEVAEATDGAAAIRLQRGADDCVTKPVTNAIRHTPAGGHVEILGRSLPAATELSVSDGCGGIPEPDLDRVLDVAWRGNHARTPDSGSGAGLGLAIVKGIVEAHDGTVTVRNEPDGCRFLVRIPAQPSSLRQDTA